MKNWELWWLGMRTGWRVKSYRWRWTARLAAWERNIGLDRRPYEVRERTR